MFDYKARLPTPPLFPSNTLLLIWVVVEKERVLCIMTQALKFMAISHTLKSILWPVREKGGRETVSIGSALAH